jgi:hypothetical protein
MREIGHRITEPGGQVSHSERKTLRPLVAGKITVKDVESVR